MIDFENLRNQWALKYDPPRSRIELQQAIDRRANPHNEPYHNKRPIREEVQIVSDLCYAWADDILTRQYGTQYQDWLQSVATQDKWTLVWKMRYDK